MLKVESSFNRSALVLVAGRTVGFICRFALAVFLARHLAQVEFGLYKQAFLLQSTFIMLLDLGLPASLYYFLQQDGEARRQYVSQSLPVLALAAVRMASGPSIANRGWNPAHRNISPITRRTSWSPTRTRAGRR